MGSVSRTIDLNADLGEEITDDEALLGVVTSANVACGGHAGTPETMRAVCAGAARLGVAVGAQVSYVDREHFGRRRLDVDPAVLADQVAAQIAELDRIGAEEGAPVVYVKPHGALYNRVVDDPEQAAAVLAGSGDLPVLGLPGGVLLAQAAAAGRTTWREGFPDRGYTADGRLVPRGEPGALLAGDQVVGQALALAPGVDSLCLHGDSPGAVTHATHVRRALTAAGWRLRPFAEA
ncbi:5-oxoprolinase subunit PxpA [Nocardioides sp. AE5]|uniref:LamB/YcsF family protein n=1 Tax=Nocardioides sp. AE5 TaxID=2962573 RepID=UPI0028810CEC|nr:5-oxoprolinase subunit PxpA [Nocardioides sp. AE5]MDT0201331.1 5-oxoprolinase subunit PxpA [Nocardioides sp. AE5]